MITSIVRSYSRSAVIAVAVLCSAAAFTLPVHAEDWNVHAAVESFTWREFMDGTRAVKESGPLFGFGASYFTVLKNRVTLKPSVEIFGGEVDYDGHTQPPEFIPATSEVNYFGLRLEGDVGRRFLSDRFFIEPFAGLGLRAWTRDIQNGTTENGDPVSGIVEDWLAIYGRIGGRATFVASGRNRFFAEGGVKIPIYNQNIAYVSDTGGNRDVTLHPGKKAAFFAEAGVRINKIKGSVFYDSFRFPESSPENGYLQPESTMDLYGVKLSYVF